MRNRDRKFFVDDKIWFCAQCTNRKKKNTKSHTIQALIMVIGYFRVRRISRAALVAVLLASSGGRKKKQLPS